MTGDPYNPPAGTVSCAPTIMNGLGVAAGSTTVLTNVDYSPYWAQYVCVFTVSDYGAMTMQVEVGNNSSSRTVTAVKLDNVTFSPNQTIAVSNSVTLTAHVLPASFAGTFIWGGITNSTGAVVTVTLDYGGHIPASLTLEETGETLWTEVVVISPTLTVYPSDDPGFAGDSTGFVVFVENNEGLPHTVTWSGAVTGTDDTATYTPSDSGTQAATATVTVGPWTGTATADQKINRWVLSMSVNDGDVVNTFQIEGPAGCFLIRGSYTNEYDFEQWVGVGTTVVTKHLWEYEALDYVTDDSDDDDGSNGGGDGTEITFPPPLTPVTHAAVAASGANPSPIPPPSPEFSIGAELKKKTIEKLIDVLTGKATKSESQSTKTEEHTSSISSSTIGAPGAITSGPLRLRGVRYYDETQSSEEALTEPFNATVSAACTSLSKKRLPAIGPVTPGFAADHIWYNGTARSTVTVSPNLVHLTKTKVVDGASVTEFSPSSVAPAVTATLELTEGIVGAAKRAVEGDPTRFQGIRNAAAVNSVRFSILGGKFSSIIASGKGELYQDDLFDSGGNWWSRQNPPGDSVGVPEVSASLTTP